MRRFVEAAKSAHIRLLFVDRRLLREMPKANKPDFSGQQKIIFQAVETGDAEAA
jgi:hypothetical protein